MYGLLLRSLIEAIQTKYGASIETTLKMCCFDKKIAVFFNYTDMPQLKRFLYILVHDHYNDIKVFHFLTLISKDKNQNVDSIMYDCGKYFIIYLMDNGYKKYLTCIGRTYEDFLNSIETIHNVLNLSKKCKKPPVFKLKKIKKNIYNFYYISSHKLYKKYCEGLLMSVAQILYNMNPTISIIDTKDEKSNNRQSRLHIIYEITMESYNDKSKLDVVKNSTKTPLYTLLHVHQHYFTINKLLIIDYISPSMNKFSSHLYMKYITDYIDFDYPNIKNISFDDLKLYRNVYITVDLKKDLEAESLRRDSVDNVDGRSYVSNSLKMSGYCIDITVDIIGIFCVPLIFYIGQIKSSPFYLSELKFQSGIIHYCIKNYNFCEKSPDLIDNSGKVDRNLELEKLKQKNQYYDELMKRILPVSYADKIIKGENVFKNEKKIKYASLLCMKITNFKEILNHNTPIDVINFINLKFDQIENIVERYRSFNVRIMFNQMSKKI
ncbi:hypothetical protein A3Q56_07541 [Intoshia linei]|uniref:Heme NO-binding domain-containing protein n=1 Tax=Intoshia linei TaxID=1819745 RepID=A0A177ARW0_9BILA|nr:hypothetical protein A3Q56_07541 [Intoshia linei]